VENLLTGHTVLVTGATGGIGKATAHGLAVMGARVAITGRDLARTDAAAREIGAAQGGQVVTFVADLSAQSEVRRLAEEVQDALPRIDVLVNNVGGYWNTRRVTVDGLEQTFALNHLAPFLLTNLLLERLKQSVHARVVTVASTLTRRDASTSTTSKESSPTPARGPTTSPSSPTSSSPTSWPDGWGPPA
jgi:NAD(P)-dependent dehydrogenase (short-subunit alcohol dehydrogenase family)